MAIIKRDGTQVKFNGLKIREAIEKAMLETRETIKDQIAEAVLKAVEEFSKVEENLYSSYDELIDKSREAFDFGIYKSKEVWHKLAFKIKPKLLEFKAFLKRLYARLKPIIELLSFLKDIYSLYQFIKTFLPDQPSQNVEYIARKPAGFFIPFNFPAFPSQPTNP